MVKSQGRGRRYNASWPHPIPMPDQGQRRFITKYADSELKGQVLFASILLSAKGRVTKRMADISRTDHSSRSKALRCHAHAGEIHRTAYPEFDLDREENLPTRKNTLKKDGSCKSDAPPNPQASD